MPNFQELSLECKMLNSSFNADKLQTGKLKERND